MAKCNSYGSSRSDQKVCSGEAPVQRLSLLTTLCSASKLCAGVKRLYDLVKVRDQGLHTAFFYALGNTLVANDLEQASRIAYGSDKRWARVVTVQVQYISHETSCTILSMV